MRKAVRSWTKQGQHQPHFQSKAMQQSSTVINWSVGFSLVRPCFSINSLEWITVTVCWTILAFSVDKGLKLTLRWRRTILYCYHYLFFATFILQLSLLYMTLNTSNFVFLIHSTLVTSFISVYHPHFLVCFLVACFNYNLGKKC